VHKSVLAELEKYKIKGLASPLLGAKDKDKDKEKEKEKDKTLFNEFFALYPRQESKKKALEAFKKALKDGADIQGLLAGVKRYRNHIAAHKVERRYIKSPVSWLNQGCWDDEYTEKSYVRGMEVYTSPEKSDEPMPESFKNLKKELINKVYCAFDSKPEIFTGGNNGI
jgi:hypothetical protein